MADSHVRSHILFVVLSHWIVPQRDTHRHRHGAWWTHVSAHLDILFVHVDIRSYGDCCRRVGWGWRHVCQFDILADPHLLRVSSYRDKIIIAPADCLQLFVVSVIATPAVLPRFWIFMYRVSPFTYLVSAMLSTGVANAELICSPIELATFNPPSGQTCSEYMATYISRAGGKVYNPNATSNCQFCSATSTNDFLTSLFINYSDRWRNFGFMWVYIITNVVGCILFYWLARVPKKGRKKQEWVDKRSPLLNYILLNLLIRVKLHFPVDCLYS